MMGAYQNKQTKQKQNKINLEVSLKVFTQVKSEHMSKKKKKKNNDKNNSLSKTGIH